VHESPRSALVSSLTSLELHAAPGGAGIAGGRGLDPARRNGCVSCLVGVSVVGLVALYDVLRPFSGDAGAIIVALWASAAVGAFALAWRMFESSTNLWVAWALCGIAFAWTLDGLAMVDRPVPFLVGRVAGQVAIAALIYLTLAYPGGRVRSSAELGFFGVAVAGTVLLLLANVLLVEVVAPPGPLLRCGPGACPRNPAVLHALSAAEAHRLGQSLAVWSGSSLLVAAGMSALRMRDYSPRERRVFGVAIAWTAILAAGLGALMILRGIVDGPILVPSSIAGTAAIVMLPVTYAIAFRRGRVMTSSSLQDLLAGIDDGVGPGVVQDALVRAFADPDLRLLVAQPGGAYVDVDGAAVDLAALSRGREVTELTRDGRPAAVLVHDPLLQHDRGGLESAGAAVLLTLDNHRLQVDLQRSVQELWRSRRRVAAAVHESRARIERDLHDGAQQSLIAIGARISRLRTAVGDDRAASEELALAAREIEVALERLRELAHGIYPAALRSLGLGPSLAALARDAPISISTRLDCERRFQPLVEAAVYFCCSEALQNIEKHCPPMVSVTLRLLGDDDGIGFEISDDGPGFDVTGRISSHGLAGMRDRINAVGGELYIHSAPGRGTTVTGTIPAGEL
jgi:signal transduction histidine kinase